MYLSIIIPTLNEADYIEQTLSVLNENLSGKNIHEVIIVDAGSTDSTLDKVKDKVDKLHVDECLRGAKFKSLNKGVELAKGEMLLFLDADCHLPRHFDVLISEVLNSHEVVGGAFEFKMSGGGFIFRMVELVNRIRYRLDQRYFGDQGVFCQKTTFDQVGGYPLQPIMEAAYFCKLLTAKGKISLIKHPIVSSIRRFDQGNAIQVFAQDLWVWVQYVLGLDISKCVV